jgi:hypothetical protein
MTGITDIVRAFELRRLRENLSPGRTPKLS